MEKKNTMHLPHELIIQILLKLPVKSLLRFKCVSKSWFTLISNPHFTNSHFQLTSQAHTHTILFIAPNLKTRSIDVESSLNDDTVSVSMNLNFIKPQSFFLIGIKNSCRGFLFMHLSSNIYLWNPSTGVHKELPLSPIGSNLDSKYCCFLYGFGYDDSKDDYYVVSMSYDTKSINFNVIANNVSSNLELFSLRDNTWKVIECNDLVKYTHFPYMNDTASDDPEVGLLFNGAIHWFSFRNDLSMDVILAFDLMETKLLEMSRPDDFNHEPIDSHLWVFGEFLSIWAMDDDTVEIWVMKEYNVQSSWTKTLVLSTDSISTRDFNPICSTQSGDIIGTDGCTGLVKYNDKGEMLGHRSCGDNAHGFQVAMYTESLLSLPGGNEQA